ncbi:MAG: universal stress protein [Hyphomonadaceae bacterium]|nr:universal stress protein [Hyphomonadaceae bacterium]
MYRIMHLTLRPHPAPTSNSAMDYACRAALFFDSKLNVTSPRLKVRTPTHVIAGGILAGLAREFEQSAAEKSLALERYVETKAKEIGIDVNIVQLPETWPSSAEDMTWRGRTSDLCLLGLPQAGIEDRLDVEEWLFGLGRPCLLYPEASNDPFKLDSVVISWDFSKSAARAVGDALPILKAAQKVHVMTVQGEKKIPVEDIKSPILDLLAAHGVKADYSVTQLGAQSIGRTILDEAHNRRADMLVMGAYGHSRLKEFVLGGATKEMLNSARMPLFMSH